MVRKHRYLLILLLLLLVVAVGNYYLSIGKVSEFEWLIEPQFEKAHDFYKGVAWVQEQKEGPWKLIDKTGKVIVDNFPAKDIEPYTRWVDLAAFLSAESVKYGFVNLSGDVVIRPEYNTIFSFKETTGTANVSQRGQDRRSIYGVIDKNENIVMPFTHDSIFHVQPNLFAIKKDKKWGYINVKKEVIADFIYGGSYSTHPLPSGLCVVVKGEDQDKKFGLIDEKGQIILPVSYDRIYQVSSVMEDLIAVSKDGQVGFVDTKGNTVIDLKFWGRQLIDETVLYYGTFYIFSEGLATVMLLKPHAEEMPTSDKQRIERWGARNLEAWVINKKGELLFRLQGLALGFFNEGFMLIRRRGSEPKYWLIDHEGKRYLLPPNLESGPLGLVTEGTLCMRTKTDSRRYKANKYGYLKIDFK